MFKKQETSGEGYDIVRQTYALFNCYFFVTREMENYYLKRKKGRTRKVNFTKVANTKQNTIENEHWLLKNGFVGFQKNRNRSTAFK